MPHVAGLGIPVKKNDGGTTAGDPIVQTDSVDLGEARVDIAHFRKLPSAIGD
jgi:hypothetical protein